MDIIERFHFLSFNEQENKIKNLSDEYLTELFYELLTIEYSNLLYITEKEIYDRFLDFFFIDYDVLFDNESFNENMDIVFDNLDRYKYDLDILKLLIYMKKYNLYDNMKIFIKTVLINFEKDIIKNMFDLFEDDDKFKSLFDEKLINELISKISYDKQKYMFDYINIDLYKSKRPKTHLKFEEKLCNNGEIVSNNNILIDNKYRFMEYNTKLLIPVIRYETEGIGIYSKKSKEQFCGTFYYFESESEYFLQSNKTIFFPNKLIAYIYLNNKNINDELLDKFMFQKILKEMIYNENFDFTSSREYLYASEDIFDQPLCSLGKKLGYDVICLMYMQGKTRIVSEVLDIRDRKISFDFICKK